MVDSLQLFEYDRFITFVPVWWVHYNWFSTVVSVRLFHHICLTRVLANALPQEMLYATDTEGIKMACRHKIREELEQIYQVAHILYTLRSKRVTSTNFEALIHHLLAFNCTCDEVC